ncbi:MAG: hypothetical protein ACXWU1_12865 [Allosphingosinicella sp.]
MSILRVSRRFRGPPDSGNGGYVAGLLARQLGGSHCTVTLLRPPPLDRDLVVERHADRVELLADGHLVASAARDDVDIAAPAPPAFADAAEAATRFTGLSHHLFPGCFVCGPQRASGDGLRIFPGRTADRGGRVAAIWTPDASLADADRRVRTEYLWAALDCPGYFALEEKCGLALLGRLGVRLESRPKVDEPLIVTGWPIESGGRKHRAGTALHDREGALVAAGEATWITLKPEP